MKYNSKHDIWLGVLMIGLTGGAAFTSLLDLGLSFTSVLIIGAFGLVCWIWFGTYYEIVGNKLFIHSGPFKSVVDIGCIKTIYTTRNPLSAPACSIDRIALKGDGVYALISPKYKEDFVRNLKHINSHIEYLSKD